MTRSERDKPVFRSYVSICDIELLTSRRVESNPSHLARIFSGHAPISRRINHTPFSRTEREVEREREREREREKKRDRLDRLVTA